MVIMDGIGVGRGDAGDAVSLARTPTLDWLSQNASYRTIRTHGTSVGLPSDDDMGNSEVGHNAIGAGRIFDQGASLVRKAIETGDLFKGELWREFVSRCIEGDKALHFIGLLSDGNVHSHETHLHAMIRQADREGVRDVRVHILLDGRDVPDGSSPEYVRRLEDVLGEINEKGDRRYRIASGGGRMVTTMDRYEADWEIVARGWKAHVLGEGRAFPSAEDAIATFRDEGYASDQDLPSFVVADDNGPVGKMAEGDCCIFFNFRGDRAIEISKAFDGGDDFDKFDRGDFPPVHYAGMTLYDGDEGVPNRYIVSPPHIDRTLSEYLAGTGVTQYAISETQKYGHVTYFWNGNRTGKFSQDLETYVEVESDRIPFERRPWMKAGEITDGLIEAIESDRYRFLRINYPNGDMVGHTGKINPSILAVEVVDLCLARVLQAVRACDGTLIVTADHGNADDMMERDKSGEPKRDKEGRIIFRTSHSLNPVGFWILRPEDPQYRLRADLPDAGLANIAATILDILGFAPPDDYLPSMIES
jgi:2,3-bisphosphoglycerate-independent phosphoglycerate mutase